MEYFECIDSTSLYLKRCIAEKSFVPSLVIAKEQTNGQGRVGKEFYSPRGTGLYMTFSFKKEALPSLHLTPRVALAVAEAIGTVATVSCQLKWVNDIYFNGGKICGILCQNVEDYILIGVGINVERPSYIPNDLSFRFQSIYDVCEPGVYSDLVIQTYEKILEYSFVSDQEVVKRYRELCLHINSPVSIMYNGSEVFGVCRGIDDDFSFLIESDDSVNAYSSGILKLL